IQIELRPELTGKTSQFGSLEELIDLTKLVNSCSPCMDFSHLYARTGEYNDYEGFTYILNKLKEELGDQSIKNMHIHLSGISSNSKGDLKHLNLEDSDFNWRDLIKALKEQDARGYVICNSPNLEKDAKLLKDFYLAL
ncbi:MAG: TIM barrel protein, partial [Bacteriovoracaceae bacterium]|nr:TIM barrel protein [Bacteriovoracaceae bacterium]